MVNKDNLPKILIVSRLVWDDNSNSNTLTNIFDGYDPDKIARIYIETKKPQTKCCHRFFQISEVALLRRLIFWNTKTGHEIVTGVHDYRTQQLAEKREQQLMSFARHHRLKILTYLRDLLWSMGGWKTRELRDFILNFDPDIVWLDGSPLILMNRLNNYVSSVAGKPSCTFLMDDVYTYKSCPSFFGRIYRYFLRKHVRKTVRRASHVFVASEKMKSEYDEIFSIDSTFIAKGAPFDALAPKREHPIAFPIKFVYLGNVLIGRFDSLTLLAKAIHRINSERGPVFELSVYTGDAISNKARKNFLLDEHIHLCEPVPYSQVGDVMAENDVVVFVEALTGSAKRIARLSFSTKIVDYIASGKCIFTIGPADSAPVEYLRNHDISLVANNQDEIYDNLNRMSISLIQDYSERAIEFCRSNHDKESIQKNIYRILSDISA